MPVRTSEATWRGGVREGEGEMALGSGAWSGGYSFRARFHESESALSNPEELIAAGLAGCFSLSLANTLEQEGFDPEEIDTSAECHLEMSEDAGPTITQIHLETEGAVPEIDEERFQRFAEDAKVGCPVSRALAGVDISVEATL